MNLRIRLVLVVGNLRAGARVSGVVLHGGKARRGIHLVIRRRALPLLTRTGRSVGRDLRTEDSDGDSKLIGG